MSQNQLQTLSQREQFNKAGTVEEETDLERIERKLDWVITQIILSQNTNQ